MAVPSDKLGINLLVGSQMHLITVSRDKEKIFRDAADYINERYNAYRQSFQNQSSEKYNAVVMLDIAVRYLQQQNNVDTTPYAAAIDKLTSEIEEILGVK